MPEWEKAKERWMGGDWDWIENSGPWEKQGKSSPSQCRRGEGKRVRVEGRAGMPIGKKMRISLNSLESEACPNHLSWQSTNLVFLSSFSLFLESDMAHFFPCKLFTFAKLNHETEDGKTSVYPEVITHTSAEASWNTIAFGCSFGEHLSENVFWLQLPRRNSETSECMRGFTGELTWKSGIWVLYYTGLLASPLLAWMYDHCQPSFSFLMLINFGFFSISEKRMEILLNKTRQW